MAIPLVISKAPLRHPLVRRLRARLRRGIVSAAGRGGAERTDVAEAVRKIIADVARRGDRAVSDWTWRLHRVRLAPGRFFVPLGQIRRARAGADEGFLRLARRAAANIRRYQRGILVKPPPPLVRGGRRLGVRYTALERVAVCVPGGRAAYPSTLLMTVVPAQVAGVGEIVLVTPPGPDGRANPLVLALAGELRVPRVLCAAGVPALAALALGTESIPPVDKIVGPGNAFIVEAKRQLFGRVGIDSIPGPSEVLIVADGTARADWLAADMLAQAEHDPGSAVLVTTSVRLARDVVAAIGRQLPTLQRRAAIEKALAEYSAIIVAPGLRAAADLANHFAPEHLQIIAADQQLVLERIRHAGAIFLGPWTPVPLGDYYAGPSHVLPTGGTARFFSALSANDFLKATSVLSYGRRALEADAPDVAEFARREGFSAHARAVEMRTEPIATEAQRAQRKKRKQGRD